jgi:predicted hydrocarbon binding protein
MFDFFKKLLMSRQMTFERGQIKIGDDVAIMVSGEALVHVTDSLLKVMKEEGARQIYLASKEGGKALGRSFRKRFGVSDVKLANLLRNLAEMGGWGQFEFININVKGKSLICHVTNSPFAKLTTNRGQKVCHMIRGLLAGGAAVGFNKDVECVETMCIADGSHLCEFIVKPVGKFDRRDDLVKKQLWWLRKG